MSQSCPASRARRGTHLTAAAARRSCRSRQSRRPRYTRRSCRCRRPRAYGRRQHGGRDGEGNDPLCSRHTRSGQPTRASGGAGSRPVAGQPRAMRRILRSYGPGGAESAVDSRPLRRFSSARPPSAGGGAGGQETPSGNVRVKGRRALLGRKWV